MTPYVRFAKPVVDRTLAAVGLVVLAPVLGGVALAVATRLGRPVLFRQRRIGRNGEPFAIVKFRTMRDDRDATGQLLPDSDRLTPLGRFLRSTSLDEIPELWNVLRGDMSLVGPRPLVAHYLPFYTAREQRRHDLLPGITGWAQVNGRNDLRWDDRLERDVWYVEHVSALLDLRILWKTVGRVVQREGAHADPRGAMLDLNAERGQLGAALAGAGLDGLP